MSNMLPDTPTTWPLLLSETQAVPPFFALRPESENVQQYMQNDRDFLAVQGQEPYGTLTHLSLDAQEAERHHLLHQVHSGRDFTVFSLPEGILTLRAITLGNNFRRANLLHEAYRAVGRTLCSVASADLPQEISVHDFAIDRRTGNVLFLPPVAFGSNNHGDYVASMGALGDSIRSVVDHWPVASADELASELNYGIDNG